jgi:hypothetical protein
MQRLVASNPERVYALAGVIDPENGPRTGDTPMAESPKNGSPKARFGKDQPQHYCGKRGRSGPAKGNANAMRHGMRGGKLPAGCQYIEQRVNSLRRQVEAAIVEAKGEIGIVDAAAVNSILKWERHGLLAAHWLRKEADKLSAADRLRFSEAIAKASDARDRNIRSLGLDVKDDRPWIDATPTPNDAGTELADK